MDGLSFSATRNFKGDCRRSFHFITVWWDNMQTIIWVNKCLRAALILLAAYIQDSHSIDVSVQARSDGLIRFPAICHIRPLNYGCYLRAVGRKVLWSSACVCLCALCLSARYLKNGFMDHHQIWWVGAGSEPVEQVQFWCWSDSGCVSRITFPFPLTLRDRAFCDI